MIVDHQNDNVLRIKSFPEFESSFKINFRDQKPYVCEPFSAIAELFLNFHPKSKPILWRMLIAQAHLYSALIEIDKLKMMSDNAVLVHSNNKKRNGHSNSVLNNFKLKMMSKEEWKKNFEWRKSPYEANDQTFYDAPFQAVQDYLQRR